MSHHAQHQLPPDATAASHLRYQVAQELAQLCPPSLGHEIVLTGSTSRGFSDDLSDIEQVFYVETLPPADERDQWLHGIYATNIIHDGEAIEDGSSWSTFHFHDIWVEAGWQPLSKHEENLHAILAGEIIDHDHLKLAATIAHAIPLHSKGFLARWQQELAHYPEALPAKIIYAAIQFWAFPHILETRWILIHRNERDALAGRLLRDVHNVLRILFALNRQWEPDWKWIKYVTRDLAIKPEQLAERIHLIFSSSTPEQSVATSQMLMYDTLLLIPPQLALAPYVVSQACIAIQESLRMHHIDYP